MPLLDAPRRHLLERAVSAAGLAADCILSYYGRDIAVASKGLDSHSGDVVTRADHEAQAIICKALGFTKANEPLLDDVAYLAEEMDDHTDSERFEKDYCFVIDPLDGTRGFLDHNNSFGVSIGLIKRDGTPVFGVAVLPGTGKRYVGIHKQWTTEGERVLTPPPLESEELVLYVSEAEIFPQDRNRLWHHICQVIQDETPIRKIRPKVIGSPVHKGCLTADSTVPALYLGLPRAEKGVSLWDLAAIAPIVTGAGGFVSDIYGKPLDLNRKQSTYVHHNGFVFCTHAVIARAAIRAAASFKPQASSSLF